ncbi:MAG: prepilin-type N-terminal cleavage/methylation domain-containing protein [Puniceicoccales bacterium]|jgi:prepilin-type N-terminal cleavage/methylation domain-containing protein|nr:prepilin-type N-terminal cleavage/methylation domain-containing protein [Puniceicoccales bacterium]
MEKLSQKKCEGFTLIEVAAALVLLLPVLLLANEMFLYLQRQFALQVARAELPELRRTLEDFLEKTSRTPHGGESTVGVTWHRNDAGTIQIEELQDEKLPKKYLQLTPVAGIDLWRCEWQNGELFRAFFLAP